MLKELLYKWNSSQNQKYNHFFLIRKEAKEILLQYNTKNLIVSLTSSTSIRGMLIQDCPSGLGIKPFSLLLLSYCFKLPILN